MANWKPRALHLGASRYGGAHKRAKGPQMGPTNRKTTHLPFNFLLIKHWPNALFHKTDRKRKPNGLRLIVQQPLFAQPWRERSDINLADWAGRRRLTRWKP